MVKSNGVRSYKQWRFKKSWLDYFNNLSDDYANAKVSLIKKRQFLEKELECARTMIRRNAIKDVIEFIDKLIK